MSVTEPKAPALIIGVSDNPEAKGKDELMTASAINRKAGKLRTVLVTADIPVAHANVRYISAGAFTLGLPDPTQPYTDYTGETATHAIGDVIMVDQIANIGAVTFPPYAEYVDGTTGDSGIRKIYEIFPTDDGGSIEWKLVLTGTGSMAGGASNGGSGGGGGGSGDSIEVSSPLVGKLIEGTSAGGVTWTFADLEAAPISTTTVYRNGVLQDPTLTSWFGLTLSLAGSVPTDQIIIQIYVNSNIPSGGFYMEEYQGSSVSGGIFSFTELSGVPTGKTLVFADGLRVKASQYSWGNDGNVTITAAGILPTADVTVVHFSNAESAP